MGWKRHSREPGPYRSSDISVDEYLAQYRRRADATGCLCPPIRGVRPPNELEKFLEDVNKKGLAS